MASYSPKTVYVDFKIGNYELLKEVVNLLQKRLPKGELELEFTDTEGRSEKFNNFDKFVNALGQIPPGEIEKLKISTTEFKSVNKYKMAYASFARGWHEGNLSLHALAEDSNGRYADWVSGTKLEYEVFQRRVKVKPKEETLATMPRNNIKSKTKDWKWIVGTLIGLASLAVGYLQL